MSEYSFFNRNFLIVDDHNFSRVTVLRTLKNMDDPRTYSATHGMEALDTLEKMSKIIDCVISDFNMPVMHGLQFLKAIRCGERGIRRDIPVIMLTAHGEADLVQVAMSLDVNGFVLKPATVESLGKRLERALEIGKTRGEWLKSAEEYSEIDADTAVSNILEFKQLSDLEHSKKQPPPKRAVGYELNSIHPGMVLARPLVTTNGKTLVNAGQVITKETIEKLHDLEEIGVKIAEIWIREN